MQCREPLTVSVSTPQKRTRLSRALWFAAFLVICLSFGTTVMATPVPVPDFSFEDIVTGPGGNVGGSAGVLLGTAPNWNSSGNAGNGVQSITNGDDFFNAPTLPAPGDGTNYFYGNIALGQSFYCWQNIAPLQPNTTYTLTIAVGETLEGFVGAGFIALVNGESPFQTILASTVVDTTNFTAGTFADSTVTYTTGAQVSGNLTILMEGTNGQQLVFDNVRLDAETPANPTALLPILSSASTASSIFTGIVAAPSNNTVYLGNAVTLTENAAGTSAFTYQWLSDNGSGGTTFSPISGATSSTVAANTSGAGTIEYEVVVTSGAISSTSPPVSITTIVGAPVVFVQTYPTTASEDTGDTFAFTASFVGSSPMSFQWQFDNGSGPTPIGGATNETLTVANVQTGSAGSYSLVASNQFGMVTNDPGVLAVNMAVTNSSDNVVITSEYQLGLGGPTLFTPTWMLATNNLLAGASPEAAVPDLAALQYGDCGGAPVLTDGKAGTMPPAGNTSTALAACGTAPAGQSITYLLPTNGAPYGWTITNITVYGGWADAGRLEQEYDIYYSTYAAPLTFSSQINGGGSDGGYAGVDFPYPIPTSIDPQGLQAATRVSLTSSTGPLLKNVAGLEFFFAIAAKPGENGWEGYGEIQVFGTPSAPSIVLISNTSPAYAGDIVGSSVTFTTSFSSPTPLTYQWFVDTGSGPGPIAGATSQIFTLTNMQDSDSGSYSCVASNGSGTSLTNSPAQLAVSDNPGPDTLGVLDAQAFQENSIPFFEPTWTLPPGSLIGGELPVSVGAGNFIDESCSGVGVFTDGNIGGIGSGNEIDMASCGDGGGSSVTYALPSAGAQAGWSITNIQIFGGWNDGGRDEQGYTIYYSTPDSPNDITNVMVDWDYLPPVGARGFAANGPNMTRMTYTEAAGGPMASNVANIEVVFSQTDENGYQGYSQIAVYGFPTPGTIAIPPALTRDIIPFIGNDVAGSSETFTALFNSSEAISYQWYIVTNSISGGVTNAVTSPVVGGTSSSLTLANLQASETGSYFVVASNSLGGASSSTNAFTVEPAPTPVNGVTESFAYQQTFSGGPLLAPTWTLASGDILEGLAPSSSAGDFQDGPFGPIGTLTDGAIGYAGGDLISFCSCGTVGSGTGNSATYTLTGSASGYNITQIVTFGGWQDGGRDQQNYTVSYATASSPGTFTTLASVFDPANLSNVGGVPNMSRVTIASSSSAPLATGVTAVNFNFANPTGQENGWQGYSELAIYGTPASPPLTFLNPVITSGSLVLAGSGGTPGSNYLVLSTTNLSTLTSEWITNVTGVFNSSGDFSNSIPINPTTPAQFFLLKIP